MTVRSLAAVLGYGTWIELLFFLLGSVYWLQLAGAHSALRFHAVVVLDRRLGLWFGNRLGAASSFRRVLQCVSVLQTLLFVYYNLMAF